MTFTIGFDSCLTGVYMIDERISEGISVMIARGEYESSKDDILRGFGIFQKKYTRKNTIIQMVLVCIALIIQIVNLCTDSGTKSMSVLLIGVCVILGIYVLKRPGDTRRKLAEALDTVQGVIYNTDIYTDRIIISTVYDPEVNGEEKPEDISTNQQENVEDVEKAGEEQDELPPATVIHLDNPGVEMTETKDLYVLYIKKINVYVIPKKAFDNNSEIREQLAAVMGTRYSVNEAA